MKIIAIVLVALGLLLGLAYLGTLAHWTSCHVSRPEPVTHAIAEEACTPR